MTTITKQDITNAQARLDAELILKHTRALRDAMHNVRADISNDLNKTHTADGKAALLDVYNGIKAGVDDLNTQINNLKKLLTQ